MSLFAVIALTSLAAAPVPPPDELQRARQSFQGEWKIVAFTRKGRASEEKELEGAKVVVKGNVLTVTINQRAEETTFTLDPKTSPATINMTKIDPEYKGEVMFGIYKQEGDKLTICCGFGEEVTPKEFKSPDNSNTCLFVLERVKK
jgi:uncharacterized protein (TIGR03067 family)